MEEEQPATGDEHKAIEEQPEPEEEHQDVSDPDTGVPGGEEPTGDDAGAYGEGSDVVSPLEQQIRYALELDFAASPRKARKRDEDIRIRPDKSLVLFTSRVFEAIEVVLKSCSRKRFLVNFVRM